MATYSNSRLNTFEQCPYKYKLHYIDRAKGDASNTIEAFMGSLVHEALEKLYKDLGFKKRNTLKEVTDFYEKEWKKQYTKDIKVTKTEYKANNYRQMGKEYLEQYYKQYHPFNQKTVLGLETQNFLKLKDGSKYHVRIDRLECKGKEYFVCDYKTNARIKLQEEADADRQLAMYGKWVKKTFPDAKKVTLVWHMLKFGKEVTSSRTGKELEKLEKEIMQIIKKIEKEKKYPTNVTNLCDYCEFKSQCPEFKHEFELEKKKIKEYKKDDGLKLVDRLAKVSVQKKELETESDALKEEIIEFAEKFGVSAVFGSNKKANVKEALKINWAENEKLEKALKSKRLLKEYTMLNKLKLNSDYKKGELPKEIKKLGKSEEARQVKLVNRKKEEE